LKNFYAYLILLLLLVSCHRPNSKYKNEFLERRSIKESKALERIVDEIFNEDTFSLIYNSGGCHGRFMSTFQINNFGEVIFKNAQMGDDIDGWWEVSCLDSVNSKIDIISVVTYFKYG